MTPAITLGRMPVEKWSDSVVVVHLGDDPRFSEEMEAASGMTPFRKRLAG